MKRDGATDTGFDRRTEHNSSVTGSSGRGHLPGRASGRPIPYVAAMPPNDAPVFGSPAIGPIVVVADAYTLALSFFGEPGLTRVSVK